MPISRTNAAALAGSRARAVNRPRTRAAAAPPRHRRQTTPARPAARRRSAGRSPAARAERAATGRGAHRASMADPAVDVPRPLLLALESPPNRRSTVMTIAERATTEKALFID